MAEAYRWVYLDDADRDAWLAESWESLAASGVAAVTLRRDGVDVYGPMSLAPPS